MSTYETTAGLGDERVKILPRRGLVKTTITHALHTNRGGNVEQSW